VGLFFKKRFHQISPSAHCRNSQSVLKLKQVLPVEGSQFFFTEVRDIVARKKMRDRVDQPEELEEKYRILVEDMGEGVVVLNKDIETTFVNDRLCEKSGYKKEEILGKAFVEERNRLAREIHDGLAQTLAYLLLKIELCERLLDNNPKKIEDIRRKLLELRKALARTIKETRRVIFELRLPRFHRMGFASVLERYFQEFRRKTGIECNLNLKLEWSLPTRVQVGTYRIIREAMNNIRMHAIARHVDVILKTYNSGNLHLIIEDDGQGFNLKRALAQSKYANNFGLMGMEEQAKILGGTFSVESAKGLGTRIEVRVPLEGRYGENRF